MPDTSPARAAAASTARACAHVLSGSARQVVQKLVSRCRVELCAHCTLSAAPIVTLPYCLFRLFMSPSQSGRTVNDGALHGRSPGRLRV